MKKLFSKMDIWLLIIMIIYSIVGLIMIFSASSVSTVLRYHVPQYHFFLRQAIFLLASFILGFLIVIRFPTSKYKYIAPFAIVGIIVALIGLFAYGQITNNAQSWYDLGPFALQPSEFSKSIIIVFLAVAYSRLEKKKVNNIYAFLIPVAICLFIAVLIALQPDFGTALIICGIVFFIFISIPYVKQNFIKVLKIGVVCLVVAALALLYSGAEIFNSRQMKRFEFRNPCERYQEDTGYQVCNGFIAIHNGGLFGVGLGNSSQKYLYLPESHTDFIFPIIVEELGLLVGVLLIVGYMIMLWRILKIARAAENLRLSILAYGVFLYLLFHILINLLGILALIPLTGVPLPLLSYGGSFTINVVIMLFVVERVNIENKTIRAKREMASITN
ncbi:MAG TPA: FtsW/RodA/SpoVE family cell cycle protein [Candidatus Caccenecus avistercoris]|nr:FtsW/RodA/SpoVE family cell cycle protein [Candidatus Caccenecus avistercoris]